MSEHLITAAIAAMDKAYAPYSGFSVGAAILDEYGAVHTGANIENAAYPQGCCAEASAISALIMAGGRPPLGKESSPMVLWRAGARCYVPLVAGVVRKFVNLARLRRRF